MRDTRSPESMVNAGSNGSAEPEIPDFMRGSETWAVVPTRRYLGFVSRGEEADLNVVDKAPIDAIAVLEGMTGKNEIVMAVRRALDKFLLSVVPPRCGGHEGPESFDAALGKVRKAFGNGDFAKLVAMSVRGTDYLQ